MRRLLKIDAYREPDMVARLGAMVDGAGYEVARQGLEWYSVAHHVAHQVAGVAGCSVSSAAGIVASLSPLVSWSVNVRNSFHVAAGRPVGYLGAQLHKARRMLAGEAPNTVLSGVKERAFYGSILEPHTSTTACIDRHMLVAAYGGDASRAAKWADGIERCQRAVFKVARSHAIPVPAAQAIIWIVQRGASE